MDTYISQSMKLWERMKTVTVEKRSLWNLNAAKLLGRLEWIFDKAAVGTVGNVTV